MFGLGAYAQGFFNLLLCPRCPSGLLLFLCDVYAGRTAGACRCHTSLTLITSTQHCSSYQIRTSRLNQTPVLFESGRTLMRTHALSSEEDSRLASTGYSSGVCLLLLCGRACFCIRVAVPRARFIFKAQPAADTCSNTGNIISAKCL